MKIKLHDGLLTRNETRSLLNDFKKVLIKLHEDRVNQEDREEDVKMREQKIKAIHNDFFSINQHLYAQNCSCELEIKITPYVEPK